MELGSSLIDEPVEISSSVQVLLRAASTLDPATFIGLKKIKLRDLEIIKTAPTL